MTANGWSKTTVKPGDVITGIGYQYADGEKIVRLERVVLADGKDYLLLVPPTIARYCMLGLAARFRHPKFQVAPFPARHPKGKRCRRATIVVKGMYR
jgi:hypothetical protein